ncbi:MAG: FAD-binding oxidoreductase [Caulobacteraceae bacterium]|nr:FAD-binding oxidoreductase [Caulobacteraceae bacterium]
MANSWYAETATPAPSRPSLTEDREVDLVIVGGGCTGLSAALHAAERGMSVVLLEGGRIGWGASGRNGGQMIPGLRKSAVELREALGLDRARALLDLAFEARSLVLELIARHAIDCDLRLTGHILGAAKASDLRWMEAEAECLGGQMAYPHVEVLSAAQTRAEVATEYHGALVDRLGGHMHPLNYALGMAQAAEAAGAAIFEDSPAMAIGETSAGVEVSVGQLRVRAKQAMLAGDALLHGIDAAVERRIMPVANYLVATAPLADPAAIIAHDQAVSDSRFVVNYYRLSRDGRLIFGGGERYSPDPPADIAAFVRPHLERVFPQLSGVRIDHAWGGLVSITRSRLPHLGRHGEVVFAHGYSGQGVLLSTLAGRLAVEAVCCDVDRFARFASLAPPPFPGGEALRGPLHTMGMLWYALRDRL